MYLSASTLASFVGLNELAMIVSGRVNAEIQLDVFEAALDGFDLAPFVDSYVVIVEKAMVRVDLALSSADKLIGAAVSTRYPEGLTQEQIDDSPLPQIASHLVKHDLMVNTDEDTRRDYDSALKMLNSISKGMLSLGQSDPSPTPEQSISVARSNSTFNWCGFGRQ